MHRNERSCGPKLRPDMAKEVNSFQNLQSSVLCLVAQLCLTLCDPVACSPPGSSVQGDSPGKNTGVGCHFLLQGILPTQGLNPYSPPAPPLQADSLLAKLPGNHYLFYSGDQIFEKVNKYMNLIISKCGIFCEKQWRGRWWRIFGELLGY